DQRRLEQRQLPPLVGSDVHLVVLGRLLGEARARFVGQLVGASGDRLGVVGDVGLLDPAAAARFDAELQSGVIRGGEKLFGIRGRGRRGRGRFGAAGESRREHQRGNRDNPHRASVSAAPGGRKIWKRSTCGKTATKTRRHEGTKNVLYKEFFVLFV